MLACATITVGAPSLRSLQEPAPSGVEGLGGDAINLCVVRDLNSSTPPFNRRPTCD